MRQHRAEAIEASLSRIEAKLDALLLALTEEDQDEPQAFDLSGQPTPRERGENEPL